MWLPALLYRMNIKAAFWIWGSIALAFSPTFWLDEEMRAKTSYWSTWLLLSVFISSLVGFFLCLAAPFLPQAIISDFFPIWVSKLAPRLPAPFSLRYCVLCLFLISLMGLANAAYAIRAAHGKALEGAGDFKNYGAENQSYLRGMALIVRRWLKVNTAIAILVAWVFVLWAGDKYLVGGSGHVVWSWVRIHL